MKADQISKPHLEFIRLVGEGLTFEKAYQQAINKKSTPKSCRESGSRLADKYSLQIQQAREKAQAIVEEANKDRASQIALKSILTQAEVDAKLCAIIEGKLMPVQQLNNQGKIYKAEVTPTAADMLKAIDLYNKRFGSNAATKSEVKLDAPLAFVVQTTDPDLAKDANEFK